MPRNIYSIFCILLFFHCNLTQTNGQENNKWLFPEDDESSIQSKNEQTPGGLEVTDTKIFQSKIFLGNFLKKDQDREKKLEHQVPTSIQSGYLNEKGVKDHRLYKKKLEEHVVEKYFRELVGLEDGLNNNHDHNNNNNNNLYY